MADLSTLPKFEPVPTVLEKARIGDIIEFNRVTYSHTALYLGEGMLMNLWADDHTSTEAEIKIRSIDEVTLDSFIRIRNFDDIAWNVFRLKPKPLEEILEHAKTFENTIVPYEFLFRNCEFYTTLWRFRKGFSLQGAIQHDDLKPPQNTEVEHINPKQLPYHLPDMYLKTPRQDYERFRELTCPCAFCSNPNNFEDDQSQIKS